MITCIFLSVKKRILSLAFCSLAFCFLSKCFSCSCIFSPCPLGIFFHTSHRMYKHLFLDDGNQCWIHFQIFCRIASTLLAFFLLSDIFVCTNRTLINWQIFFQVFSRCVFPTIMWFNCRKRFTVFSNKLPVVLRAYFVFLCQCERYCFFINAQRFTIKVLHTWTVSFESLYWQIFFSWNSVVLFFGISFFGHMAFNKVSLTTVNVLPVILKDSLLIFFWNFICTFILALTIWFCIFRLAW